MTRSVRQKIFIGDVQGCGSELDALIRRATDAYGSEFELWCVGDLVNRGPSNLRVLTTVRDLERDGRAFCVLGNHDIALIAIAFGVRELGPFDTVNDVLESRDVDDWIDWLRRQPLSRTGELEDGTAFAMVHAAVHPDWSRDDVERAGARVSARLAVADRSEVTHFLGGSRDEDADFDLLGRLTRCRSVAADGRWSSQVLADSSDAWHQRWSARNHDYGVIYGHWALQGLHVASGLRGLDTGCVHHGRGRDGFLTAWLPSASTQAARGPTAFAVPDDRFWQIPAERAYYSEVRAQRGEADA